MKKGVVLKYILVGLAIIALFCLVAFVYNPITGKIIKYSTSDKTIPLVTIESPSNGSSVIVGESIFFKAQASDNRGVKEIRLYVRGSMVKKCRYLTSCQYTVTPSSLGSYSLKATAYDSAGNQASSTITISATPIVEEPAPTPTPNSTSCSEPLTETQVSSCPIGYTGTITQTRTKGPSPECAWNDWVVTSYMCNISVSSEQDDLSNEPAGFTKLSENQMSCLTNCGNGWGSPWWISYPDAITVVTNETTPTQDSRAVQILYTPAQPAGSSPATMGPSNLPQRQDIYVSTWMKFSPNFEGHSSGVNKILHFFTRPGTSANNLIVFVARGSGSGTLVPAMLTQRLAEPYTYVDYTGKTFIGREINFNSNPEVCKITRGEWNNYEMVLHDNTPGIADGSVQLWMDGVKCIDQTGIMFVNATSVNKWETIWWSPTWGGTGGVPSTNFYEQMDHIYISGK